MERNFSLQSLFNVPNTRYIALDSFLVSSHSFSSLLPTIDDEIYRSRNFLIDEAKQRSLSFLSISIPTFLSSKSTKFSAIFGELQWLQNVFVSTRFIFIISNFYARTNVLPHDVKLDTPN